MRYPGDRHVLPLFGPCRWAHYMRGKFHWNKNTKMQDPFFKAAPVNLIDVVSKSAGNIYPSGKYDVFPKIVLLTNHETLYNLDIVLSCHPPFEPIIALFTITGL